jgi:hypothetical protein
MGEIENIWVDRFKDHGFDLGCLWGWNFSRVIIEYSGGDGIRYTGSPATGLKVVNSKIISNDGYDIYLVGYNNTIIGNEFGSFDDVNNDGIDSVYIEGDHNNIIGNVWYATRDSTLLSNALVINGSRNNIIGNTISGGATRYAHGIVINDSDDEHNKVIGNTFIGTFGGRKVLDLGSASNPTQYAKNSGFWTHRGGIKSYQCIGGETSFTVSHSLSLTPNFVIVVPQNIYAQRLAPVRVDSVGKTTFTVHFSTGCTAGIWYDFYWYAGYDQI